MTGGANKTRPLRQPKILRRDHKNVSVKEGNQGEGSLSFAATLDTLNASLKTGKVEGSHTGTSRLSINKFA